MEIVTADWETYYDKDYSLSKMSTEEYVRDPRFQAIMLDLRWPDGTHELILGSHAEIQRRLGEVDWSKYAILAHNCMFDAAIFAWRFGVQPAAWLDTLSMARAMFGGKGNSLASLAKRFNLPDKGTEVLNALGKHAEDFTPGQMAAYADYCRHDVDLCHDLFELMSQGWYDLESMDKRHSFPTKELELIDKIIRMFTEPTLRLNKAKLEEHLHDVVTAKEALLARVTADKETLMSNQKFASLLTSLGVDPPQKISPTTNKWTFAFAKTDPGMKTLLEHPNPEVQALAAARMGVKSTLEETRTQRFIDMAARSELFPVPLRYSAARTHRLGGMDGINMQNLPARGEQAGKLKSCIEAPPGHVLIDCDSSNIEARMLAWLAGQDDLVDDFANGVDVYCKMASLIFGREITKADTQERFVGKTVVLGCGYQTGKVKLQATLKAAKPPMDLPIEECERIINIYRDANYKIRELWAVGEMALQAMHDDKAMWFGREGVVLVEGRKGIKLPNGLYINYPQLHRGTNDMTGRPQWMYKDIDGITNIYGGKLVENCIAEGALVLTTRGWVPIEEVQDSDLVHDGVEFVTHGGLVNKSVQACVSIDGVLMTPDHEVLTNDGWIPASQDPKPYRPDLRHVDGVKPRAQQREEAELALSVSVWGAVHQGRGRCDQGDQTWGYTQLRLRNNTANQQREYYAWDVQTSGVRGVEVNDRPLQAAFASSVEKLWWAGYHCVRTLAVGIQEFLGGHGAYIPTRVGFGPQGQRWAVQSGELSLGYTTNELHEQARYRAPRGRSGTQQIYWHTQDDDLLQASSRMVGRSIDQNAVTRKQVYDIVNCGPRHRFVVRGNSGPFIVHNCVQALARIVVMYQLLKISKRYRVVLTVHDAVAIVAPKEEADEARAYVEQCMRWVPKWAQGCPINCESGIGENYGAC